MSYEGPFPIPVASGGTGASTLTGVLTGNGTSAFTGNALTQYNTLVAGASNSIGNIAPGTSGQVLASNGVSSNPSYQAADGTNWVFLQQQAVGSVASVNFTSIISATYTTYVVLFYNLYSANNADNLLMNVSTNNGGAWIATNYISANWYWTYTSSTQSNTNSTTSATIITSLNSTTSNPSCCGYLMLQNLGAASYFTSEGYATLYAGTNTGRIVQNAATNTSNTTVNAIQFVCSTGNIAQGTFSMYGVLE